jgi:hypothetical protein
MLYIKKKHKRKRPKGKGKERYGLRDLWSRDYGSVRVNARESVRGAHVDARENGRVSDHENVSARDASVRVAANEFALSRE